MHPTAPEEGRTVDEDILLAASRAGLAELIPRVAELIRSLPDPHLPVPGSAWSAREVAVHLVVVGNLHAEIATGTPSPLRFADAGELAALNAGLIADFAETDPAELAALVTGSLRGALDATIGRSGGQRVTFHNGTELTLARMTDILLGEAVRHGSAVAATLGRAWPIESAQSPPAPILRDLFTFP